MNAPAPHRPEDDNEMLASDPTGGHAAVGDSAAHGLAAPAVPAVSAAAAGPESDATDADGSHDGNDGNDGNDAFDGTPATAAAGTDQDAEPVGAAPAGAELPADGYVAPAMSAAQSAAEFVARIFADVEAPPAQALAAAAAAASSPEGADAGDGRSDEPAPPLAPLGEALAGSMQGRQVLILGLGASGLAMARWCARCGAGVTVADTRDAPPQLATLRAELPQVRFIAGAFDAALVQTLEQGAGLDAVYRSPGLSPQTIAPVLIAASAHGIGAAGELALYSQALAGLRASHGYAPAVLGVTGTNGKTTVTSLTGLLADCAGRSVAVAGNIGPTLMDTLAQHIDADTLPEVWVLELSSFQLDDAAGFEPTAATVLNISQDHLDWHGDLAAYARAKSRIFGQTGLMVLNRDDPSVMEMLDAAQAPAPAAPPEGAATAKKSASRAKAPKPVLRNHVTFGGDMPRRPGDFGIEVVGGMAWLVRAQEADETARRPRATAAAADDLFIQRLMPADALRIRGRHNAVNALAALALAHAAGCALGPMLYGLREYRGEPHRVEPIGMVGGIEYFDDSKGTNVGATVAALNGLGADRRVVVILGGDGKGQDFTLLAAPVARYARAVVLIGRDGPQIGDALRSACVPVETAATLPEAEQRATQLAQAGDAVLMSPACASFDMFTGYEHRARVFCEAVRDMAHEAGHELEGMA